MYVVEPQTQYQTQFPNKFQNCAPM